MLRHNPAEMNNSMPPLAKGVYGSTANANNNHIENNNIDTSINIKPLTALQKQFVLSMKTLFDILDQQRTGFIKFSDIEKGCQDDTCKGLPRGVLESLRKVTPSCGLLSFDRFCAGLKLCLMKHQKEPAASPTVDVGVVGGGAGLDGFVPTQCVASKAGSVPQTLPKAARPPSAPMLEIENPLPNTHWKANPNSATTRPHNILTSQQRALSMPQQLSPDSELEAANGPPPVHCLNGYCSPAPPPKPPRASAVAPTNVASMQHNKAEIRYALQNWQMNTLLNEMDAQEQRKTTFLSVPFQYRGCADGGSSSATTDSASVPFAVTTAKKNGGKRRESRRHTLQNGIDYNMLRRLKQLEEEREVLILSLSAVEKARDWYFQQVSNVQEKIKHLGRMGTNGAYAEHWSEVQQERLNLQRARVLEVNRNLAVLVDTWEHGSFPSHLNLAIRSRSPVVRSVRSNGIAQRICPAEGGGSTAAGSCGIGVVPPAVDRLRQPGRHFSNERSLASEDRIATLEREKQTLLRELYDLQQRAGLTARNRTGFLSVLSQSSPVCSSSSGGLGDADVVY